MNFHRENIPLIVAVALWVCIGLWRCVFETSFKLPTKHRVKESVIVTIVVAIITYHIGAYPESWTIVVILFFVVVGYFVLGVNAQKTVSTRDNVVVLIISIICLIAQLLIASGDNNKLFRYTATGAQLLGVLGMVFHTINSLDNTPLPITSPRKNNSLNKIYDETFCEWWNQRAISKANLEQKRRSGEDTRQSIFYTFWKLAHTSVTNTHRIKIAGDNTIADEYWLWCQLTVEIYIATYVLIYSDRGFLYVISGIIMLAIAIVHIRFTIIKPMYHQPISIKILYYDAIRADYEWQQACNVLCMALGILCGHVGLLLHMIVSLVVSKISPELSHVLEPIQAMRDLWLEYCSESSYRQLHTSVKILRTACKGQNLSEIRNARFGPRILKAFHNAASNFRFTDFAMRYHRILTQNQVASLSQEDFGIKQWLFWTIMLANEAIEFYAANADESKERLKFKEQRALKAIKLLEQTIGYGKEQDLEPSELGQDTLECLYKIKSLARAYSQNIDTIHLIIDQMDNETVKIRHDTIHCCASFERTSIMWAMILSEYRIEARRSDRNSWGVHLLTVVELMAVLGYMFSIDHEQTYTGNNLQFIRETRNKTLDSWPGKPDTPDIG